MANSKIIVTTPNLDELLTNLGDTVHGVTDWRPWHPLEDHCSNRNISEESLHACIAIAGNLRVQAPQAQRVDCDNHVEVTVGTEMFERPKGEMFIDFLLFLVNQTFGQKWADEQYSLPPEQRHVVMRHCVQTAEIMSADILATKVLSLSPRTPFVAWPDSR